MYRFNIIFLMSIFCISGFLARGSFAGSEGENAERYSQLNQEIRTHKARLTLPTIMLAATPDNFADAFNVDQNNQATAVVIDFDQCLMREHWVAEHKKEDIANINPTATDFGIDDPQSALHSIISMPNVLLAVASFGREDIITKALQEVLSPEDMKKVIIKTPSNFGLTEGVSMDDGKNQHLNAISSEQGTALGNIIFFDDNKSNINLAKGMGVESHHAQPFTQVHLDQSLQFIQNRRSPPVTTN